MFGRTLRNLLLASVAVVGASGAAHADAPATCALDGDVLAVELDGALALELASSWSFDAEAGAWTTVAPIDLLTPHGHVTLPSVAAVTVDCDPGLHITGTLDALPLIGGLPGWGSSELSTESPTVSMGLAHGHELEGLGAPVRPDRPYLYFHASSQVGASFVDGNYTLFAPGEAGLVLLDVTDPAFYVHIGGTGGSFALNAATLGLVDKVGLGFSRGGNLVWTSTMPMWDGQEDLFAATDGDGLAPRSFGGHLFRSGKFGLIPIPNLPANLKLDGDAVFDLGAYPEAAEALAAALADDPADLSAALAATGLADLDAAELLAQLQVAGNAHTLSIDVGPLGVTIAEATFHVDAGGLVVAGRGFTPGAAMQDSDDPTLRALSMLTFREEVTVHGFVDADGWSFRVHGDFAAGPFALNGVTLVLDSVDGVRLDLGGFELDWDGFVAELEGLMDCDWTDGLDCSIAGVELVLGGRVEGDALVLEASFDLWGLRSAGFEATIAADGRFSLTAKASVNLIANSFGGTFTITHQGLSFEGHMARIGGSVTLGGHLSWDGFDFSLHGTGTMGLAGFQISQVSVSVTPSGATLDGRIDYQVGSAQVSGGLSRWTGWSLTGAGSVEVLGYELASVQVSVNRWGLFVEGGVHLHGLSGQLSGFIGHDGHGVRVLLGGSGQLRVGGHTLANVSVHFDSRDGLTVSGRVGVLSTQVEVEGRFEPNGDLSLSTHGRVNVPLGSVMLTLNVTLEREGGDVTLRATGSAGFAGADIHGSLTLDGGVPVFTGSAWASSPTLNVGHPCFPDFWNGCSTRVRASGTVSLTVAPWLVSASFGGSVYVNGNNWGSVSLGVNSRGEIVVGTPVGDVTLDLL